MQVFTWKIQILDFLNFVMCSMCILFSIKSTATTISMHAGMSSGIFWMLRYAATIMLSATNLSGRNAVNWTLLLQYMPSGWSLYCRHLLPTDKSVYISTSFCFLFFFIVLVVISCSASVSKMHIALNACHARWFGFLKFVLKLLKNF